MSLSPLPPSWILLWRWNSVKLLDRIWHSSTAESEPSPADKGPGHGTPWSRRRYLRTDQFYQFRFGMEEAVKHEGIQVMEWMISHFRGCGVSPETVNSVAGEGRIDLLQLFLDQADFVDEGVDGDGDYKPLARDANNTVCWGGMDLAHTARRQQKATMQWLLEHVPGPRLMARVALYVAMAGDLDMLDWIQEHGNLVPLTPEDQNDISVAAAGSGDVDTLEWVYFNFGIDPDNIKGTIEAAAAAGSLVAMDWLLRHAFLGDAYTAVYEAINKNRIDMVTWLIDHQLVEAGRAMEVAATRGKVDIARFVYDKWWLKIGEQKYFPLSQPVVSEDSEENCPWISEKTMVSAAMNGHLNSVIWLLETFRDDPDIDLFAQYSVPRSQLENELIDHDVVTEDGSLTTMDYAAMNGHLQVLTC